MPPEATRSGVMRVKAPALEKLEVAVAPKYAGPYEEKSVVEAEARVERPVNVGEAMVGEVARTTSPVPVQVKSEEVAMLAASAVAPVMFPSTLLAETWARLANGRSPVTPVERGRPVAFVRVREEGVPSHDAPEMES